MTLPLLAVGAVGVVGVATHWAGADAGEMFDAVGQGRHRRRPAGQRPPARELRLRDRRRRARTRSRPRRCCARWASPVGRVPPADGPDARLAAGPGPRGARQPRRWRRRSRPSDRCADRCLTRSASPSSAASGRSAATAWCSSSDGRLLLIDCGLMFPDADMHGIDLVLPDFTYLRENADRIDGVRRHPRPRGPRRRRCRTCCASCSFPIYGSALTLGLARNRIEEAGLLGRTELDHGGRRRAPHDRPVRRRVHPRHPLGARTPTPSPCTRRRA